MKLPTSPMPWPAANHSTASEPAKVAVRIARLRRRPSSIASTVIATSASTMIPVLSFARISIAANGPPP